MTEQHFAHRQRDQGSREDDAYPEPPAHVFEFRIAFLCSDRARLQCHAADRAASRTGAHNFGMHRAGVFSLPCGSRDSLRLERHPTLRTSTGFAGAHLWIHRADVVTSARWRLQNLSAELHQPAIRLRLHGRRSGRSQVLRRILLELRCAALAAKIEVAAVVSHMSCSSLRCHSHPANWVKRLVDCRRIDHRAWRYIRSKSSSYMAAASCLLPFEIA